MTETANAMTVGEFKAWLEGFEEAMGTSPNIKQWKKIKERFASVTTKEVVTYPWYPYRAWWPSGWYGSTITVGTIPASETTFTLDNSTMTALNIFGIHQQSQIVNKTIDDFNFFSFATDIGKSEAAELS